MSGVSGFFRNLFGRKPAPIDRREWNEDWGEGDLAKCLDGGWNLPPGYCGRVPARGEILRVVRVAEGITYNSVVVVSLAFDGSGKWGFECTSFRKLRPSLEACDEQFAVELRDRLTGKPVPAITEHRPRVLPTPTLASGAALPPEGPSACGTTGTHNRVRMAGNGETNPLNDTSHESAEALGLKRSLSFHASEIAREC